jgi:hypothetical protein
MTPPSLPEFLLYCGIIAGGGVLVFIIQRFFGFRELWGKRLLTFAAGSMSFVYGGVIAIVFQNTLGAYIGAILPDVIVVALLLLGLYLVPLSFFGANQTIEKVFKDIVGRFG